MTTSDPLTIVQSLYAAFGRRDAEVLTALLDPELEWIQNEGFPGGGVHRGAEYVLGTVLRQFRRDWTDFRAAVAEWHACGNTVIAIGQYEGTHGGTGRSVRAAFAHVYEVRQGRVIRFRQFTDTAMIRVAMGVGLPEPA